MEWTKLRTVPANLWWLLGIVLAGPALSAMVGWSLDAARCDPRCDIDLAKASLSGVYLSQVAVIAIACTMMSTEYDTMLIRSTLAAVPNRLKVFVAKGAVLACVVLVASTLAVAGIWTAGQAILPHRGFVASDGHFLLSLADGPTRRAYAGTVAYLLLVAMLSLGIATVVRHPAGAVSTVLGLLFIAPIVTPFITNATWHERVNRYAPMPAGLSIQSTRHLSELPAPPSVGLAILVAYAATAVVIGGVAFTARDT